MDTLIAVTETHGIAECKDWLSHLIESVNQTEKSAALIPYPCSTSSAFHSFSTHILSFTT